jgi:hypothetical protein
METTPEKLIAKIIDLEEQANAHLLEYQKLLLVPKSKTLASRHNRQATRLQSRIQKLIKEIAEEAPFLPVFSEDNQSDRHYHS